MIIPLRDVKREIHVPFVVRMTLFPPRRFSAPKIDRLATGNCDLAEDGIMLVSSVNSIPFDYSNKPPPF